MRIWIFCPTSRVVTACPKTTPAAPLVLCNRLQSAGPAPDAVAIAIQLDGPIKACQALLVTAVTETQWVR